MLGSGAATEVDPAPASWCGADALPLPGDGVDRSRRAVAMELADRWLGGAPPDPAVVCLDEPETPISPWCSVAMVCWAGATRPAVSAPVSARAPPVAAMDPSAAAAAATITRPHRACRCRLPVLCRRFLRARAGSDVPDVASEGMACGDTVGMTGASARCPPSFSTFSDQLCQLWALSARTWGASRSVRASPDHCVAVGGDCGSVLVGHCIHPSENEPGGDGGSVVPLHLMGQYSIGHCD